MSCSLLAQHRRLGVILKGVTSRNGNPIVDGRWLTLQRSRFVSTTSSSSSAPSGEKIALGGIALAGGFAAWTLARSGQESLSGGDGERRTAPLKPMQDEVFETSDNLFVFMLEPSELLDRKEELQALVRQLAQKAALRRVNFFYKTRNAEAGPGEPVKTTATTFRVMLYKGQRRLVLQLNPDVTFEQLNEVMDFFSPRSETLSETLKKLPVGRVSGLTFDKDILVESEASRPILLQMYEDSCFLCFLMRPFINSLVERFQEHGIPLRIRRLNLERNDFPVGCPVARGTPTFVLFVGSSVAPKKWEEFKPDELVDKIRKEFPAVPAEVFNEMHEMQEYLTQRMQMFMKVVMWTVELQRLEELYNSSAEQTVEQEDPAEDPAFDSIVTQMMLKDMKRQDGLQENLQYLETEALEVEKDVALLGSLLAEKVLERERSKGIQHAW